MTDKRYHVETDQFEISLKDNITKKYPFSLVCENIDEFEPLLNEVTNVCADMNRLWEQSQSHSLIRLSMENKELKKEIEYLKSSDNITRLEIRIRKLKEENKKLQSEISWENIKYGTLKILEDENKELKQFKEKVFEIIDGHIVEERRFPREITPSEKRAIVLERRIGKVELLETLKKEISE